MKKIAIFIASIFVVFSGYFLAPAPLVHAQTNSVSTGELTGQTNIETALSSGCDILTNFSLCVLSFIYHVILGVSFWVVGLVANIFDFFLGYTLNSEAYQSEFIVKGWGIIRDIANVAFIFTLLYLAIRHILGMSAKKYIPTLIIVALLLNFSLFFTRVVVDAGNILARAFYQSINIENDEYSAESGYRGISAALVEKINPQRLLSESIFKQQITTGDVSTTTGGVIGSGTAFAAQDLEKNMAFYVGVFLLLAFVNFTLAGIFLSVALLMVGRTVGLWFAMIFSPIAFITLAVPGSGGFVKQLSFDTWKDTVLKLSFVAPIFIFFLYLTIMFLTIFFETPIAVESQDTFMRIMSVFIPFIFVITILKISKTTAEDMAGTIGGTVKSLVGKALGVVGGVALGGAAFAGRAVLGRVAAGELATGNYEKRIADAKGFNKWRLMEQRALLKKVESSSLDIRNAPKAKGWVGKASGVVGGGFSSAMKDFGGDKMTFGKGSDQNRKKFEEDAEKRRLKLGEELSKVSDSEKLDIEIKEKTYKEKYKVQKEELDAIKKERSVISEKLIELNKPGFKTPEQLKEKEELEKKEQDVKKREDDKSAEVQKIEKEEKPLNLKDEQKRRRDEYARTVKEGWIAVDGRSLFNPYGIATGNAQQTANKIRKEEKAESDDDKLVKMIKKVVKQGEKAEKEESGEGKEEEKKEDKSKDEEKK